MIVFPNCKINLGLYVGAKRPDGFHNLQTVFYPVPLSDALELIRADSATTLSLSGIPVPAPLETLSPYLAWQLLRTDFPQIPFLSMRLHKVVPAGAGLGGGSADGSFALKAISEKFALGLSTEQLETYAARLGSDCPFFIRNTPAYAEGRGELLEPVALSLQGYSLLLINPGIHVHTGWAFGQVHRRSEPVPLKELIQLPVPEWKDVLENDFEPPVFAAHPEIGELKEGLYRSGAVYASMSGSGSTVFGIFQNPPEPLPAFPNHYFVKVLPL